MKNSKSLLIWIIALALLFTAAYIFYSKNKNQNLNLPPLQNNAQQNTGQATTENDTSENIDSPQSPTTVEPNEQNNTVENTVDQTDKIMVPDFELKDLDGNSVKLSDYRDKIVVLNFWAVWCKYCVLEMPDFNELNKELEEENDAVILAVNVQESEKTVRDFLSSKKIDLKVLMDENGTVAGTYGIEGLPTTFVIDRDGSLYTYIPGATDKETLRMLIDKVRKGEPLN